MNIKIKDFFRDNKSLLLYTIFIVFVLFIGSILMSNTGFGKFLKSMELKTFDIRQSIIADKKNVSDAIRIITVDDESYEYVINKYGEWPIPRHVYADILDYIEAQKPSVVGFDLLFVHSLRNNKNSDERLGEAFAKYDNAFAAINFDDRDFTVRKPVNLPKTMASGIKINSDKINIDVYKNCRAIIPQIISKTYNIGHINTAKDDDGITRSVPLYVAYPDYKFLNNEYIYDNIKYYPYMTFKMFLQHIAKQKGLRMQDIESSSSINNKFIRIMHSINIPISLQSKVMLNWYGETGLEDSKNFKYIPLWKVIESMENKNGKNTLANDTFTDKVVFVGTSVFSLSDIKSVPTSKYMPGVEIHATLFNNLMDNSFIKPASDFTNILIGVLIAGIIAFSVFYCSSVFAALGISTVLVLAYLYISTIVMEYTNIWMWDVLPVVLSVLAIIFAYVIKYVLKSKDFELTYKLATTDGLTDLYNHRFFQEQMSMCIADCNRYGRKFSLIMIDIDFFKKFNDTYGHQAGDAVLRGVAHTLKKNVRSSDIVCRYGGEEMAIILKDTDYAQAFIAAEKICKTIAEKPFKIAANTEKQVTISLGVSTYPENGQTTQEMIEFADRGLYAAKENGRNQVGIVK